ncbi:MAG: hypothetical protein OXT65_08020 [Alphaproteobacteria bacterium]|nr:hypothetical protein [Alphaproteobacteria bacterium]
MKFRTVFAGIVAANLAAGAAVIGGAYAGYKAITESEVGSEGLNDVRCTDSGQEVFNGVAKGKVQVTDPIFDSKDTYTITQESGGEVTIKGNCVVRPQ